MLPVILLVISAQIGVDAGPAYGRCGDFPVTLTAVALNPPANFEIFWDGTLEPYVHQVVNPQETTEYRVFLTDLDSNITYEDTTRVLVHAGDPDLNGDGFHNQEDRAFFMEKWPFFDLGPGVDADGDGRISILDSFYLCDHDSNPPNTPPFLSVNPAFGYRDNTLVIPYDLSDDEQFNPVLVIDSQGDHGTAFLINQQLYYAPQPGFTGLDHFLVHGFDGTYSSPIRTVDTTIEVILYSQVRLQIFAPVCGPCHIDDMEGGLSLLNYLSTLQGGSSGIPGIVPGNLNDSFIWTRVSSNQMPPAPIPSLNQDQKALLRAWIESGAPEN